MTMYLTRYHTVVDIISSDLQIQFCCAKLVFLIALNDSVYSSRAVLIRIDLYPHRYQNNYIGSRRYQRSNIRERERAMWTIVPRLFTAGCITAVIGLFHCHCEIRSYQSRQNNSAGT